jgi:hypothetical protein
MSPACFRYFLWRVGSPVRLVRGDDSVAQAARLIFDAIMSAPDLPMKRLGV